jgi:hypothetical protein
MTARPSRAVCLPCHGRDDSPGFHAPKAWEEKYLPAVDHREVPPDRRTLGR